MVSERVKRGLLGVENSIASLALAFLALLPVAEVIVRLVFHTGIPASNDYLRHLVLWVTFLGGMLTSRAGRHLSMSVGVDLLKNRVGDSLRIWDAIVASAVTSALAWGSVELVLIGFDPTMMVGFLPTMVVAAIMPIGYGFMAVRFVLGARAIRGGAIAWAGPVLGLLLGIGPVVNILSALLPNPPAYLNEVSNLFYAVTGAATLPAIIILIASAFVGTPVFAVLGGIAYMLFAHSGGSLAVIPNEAYTMLTGESIAAIPLFAFVGFLLSESKAASRLVSLFKALFGWLPGGLAIMSVLVCAFFTTFTGASGVTILALGGLLVIVLTERGFSPSFSRGLLTSSGSIGLLFPPSLPIILYGVVAQINIKDLFIAGILPGVVLVLTLSGIGVANAVRHRVEVTPFSLREAGKALRDSVWEILLPVIILVCYFGGVTTLVETASAAVVYTFIVVVFIKRDLKLTDIPGVMLKCLPIIGGVLVILAIAKGLSYFIVDARVPMHLTAWVELHIHSKYLFLILLNLALLVTGSLMDIFSAILVVAPLVIPVGALFGVNPIHLGIIFLANLELGFLAPPVGINLFLASYRFEQPLVKIYRNVLPFSITLFLAVLLITYVPWFATGLLSLFKAGG